MEEATRIPRYYLEILEGGGDGRLVSDRLYMVHFLRTYASFLEVEVETLAAQFVRENRQLEPADIIPASEPRSWKATAMVTLTLLLAAAIGVYLYDPALVGGPVERLLVRSAPAPPETPAPGTSPVPITPPRTDDAQSSVLQPEATETDPSRPRLVASPPASPPEPAPALEPVAAVQQQPPAQPDVAASPAAQDVTVPSAAEDTPAPQTGQVAAVSPPAPDTPASPPAQEVAASQRADTTGETTSTAEPQQQQGPASATQTAQGPDPAASPEVAAVSTPPDTAAGTAANHTLTIAAEQKSWMRVWVDGEPFQDLLLGPGESRTLSAQTHFVITFGNAGGVRLTLNGEELPPVGRSGEVVRGRKFPPDE